MTVRASAENPMIIILQTGSPYDRHIIDRQPYDRQEADK